MEILINILIGILILNALLVVMLVLMQRPKSEGLGAAFGGGITENIFGGQTSNVLSKMTTYLAVSFFLVGFIIAVLHAQNETNKSRIQEELLRAEVPLETESASPSAAEPTDPSGFLAPTESPSSVAEEVSTAESVLPGAEEPFSTPEASGSGGTTDLP